MIKLSPQQLSSKPTYKPSKKMRSMLDFIATNQKQFIEALNNRDEESKQNIISK